MADMAEVGGYGTQPKSKIVGRTDGNATLDGTFDSAVGALDPVLVAALGSSSGQLVSWSPEGMAIHQRVSMLKALTTSYDVDAQIDDAVRAASAFEAADGVDAGWCLHNLTAETAIGAYGSHDYGGATGNGGVAHLHVTALAGFTSVTIKIQHSTNDSTWVDLVTFAAVTAVGKERVLVAAGTRVNRYVRGTITAVAGAGSIMFAIAFARR
jgi:hypothetical protein